MTALADATGNYLRIALEAPESDITITVSASAHDSQLGHSIVINPDYLLFTKAADEWEQEVVGLSMLRQMTNRPSYHHLQELGESIVPYVLDRLRAQPSVRWCYLLCDITGENPVDESDRGSVPAMANAWQQWGASRGHS